MRQALIHKTVELARDLTELGLRAGAVGSLIGSWKRPTAAYEVEFQTMGLPVHLLVLKDWVHEIKKS
jgi:hypothetical protein